MEVIKYSYVMVPQAIVPFGPAAPKTIIVVSYSFGVVLGVKLASVPNIIIIG